MMEHSARLSLPYIQPSQAQKHVTHNEAVQLLDLLVQLVVEAFGATSPPALPDDGQVWALGPAPTDAWAGQAGMLAAWDQGGWMFIAPQAGWRAWGRAEAELRIWDGGEWVGDGLDNRAGLGINASHDATNRLAVSSPATLLTHEGAGHQLKINKAAASETASVLFQTDWSGRAEIGLAGEDNFSFKVSPDGSEWQEALRLDRTSGQVTMPAGRRHAASGAQIAEMLWTPGADGVTSLWFWSTHASAQHAQNPRTAVIDSISGDQVTITTSDGPAIFGFWSGFMEGVSLIRVWNLSRAPIQSAWIRSRPADDRIEVSDSAHLAGWQAGDTIQLGDPTSTTPGRVVAVDISPMLQQVFGTVFRQTGMILRGQLHTPEAGQRLEVSPTGLGGSFVQTVTTVGAGAFSAGGTTMIPCTEPSPVSNSNLLFVREQLASTATVSALSSIAITV